MRIGRLLLSLIVISFFSCAPRKSNRYYEPEGGFPQSSEVFVLDQFDVYTYKLCEKDIGDRKILQNCDTDCNQPMNEDVIEEVYFLLPNNEADRRVIYFTTLSFLEQAKQKFHEADYAQSILLSDLDYLFIGKLKGDNAIAFEPNRKKIGIEWEIRRDSCSIEILSVPYILHKKQVDGVRMRVSDVLKGGVTFYKSDRQVAFKKDHKKKVRGCPRVDALLEVDTLFINPESNKHKIVFKTENTTDCERFDYISFNNGQLLYY